MKKRSLLLLICIFLLLFSACGKDEPEAPKSGKFYECQKGFMDVSGSCMCETPDGYYFMVGPYLMFADQEFKKPVIVCDKAECLHNQEHPEKKINCNAFFYSVSSLGYYNGKLYVAAENMNAGYGEHEYCIYEVSPDGSEREVIYTSEGVLGAFCIHRGSIYADEGKFTDEDGNVIAKPITTVSRFPVKNPKEKEVLFETDEYERASINYLTCYQDYCYFRLIEATSSTKIHLKTKEVSDFPEGLSYFGIGKDRLYAVKTIDNDIENQTWTSAYYECGLDGEIKKELTAEEFPILEKDVLPLYADDDYVYFGDVDYGGNEVPEENRKMYACTYDGELVCEVPFPGRTTVWGNERYVFYTKNIERAGEDGESDTVYYYVDKDKFGKDARFEVMFHTNGEEYSSEVWRTY